MRDDALTISYVPNTYSQTTIRQPMPQPSAELKVDDQANCPHGQDLCGFTVGMTVLLFDEEGHFDFFTVTNVQDNAAHLQHRQQDLSYPYAPPANIVQADSHTYYYDDAQKQLRHYDDCLTGRACRRQRRRPNSTTGDPNPPVKPASLEVRAYADAGSSMLGGLNNDDTGRRWAPLLSRSSVTVRGAAAVTTGSTPISSREESADHGPRRLARRPCAPPDGLRWRAPAGRARSCRTTRWCSTSSRAT